MTILFGGMLLSFYAINKCIYCGNEFKTRNPNAFCCKDIECLRKHSRSITSELHEHDFKYQKICQVCGEKFYTNNKKAKCCNSQCAGSFGILGSTKRYGDPQYTEDVICDNCGNYFKVKKGTARSHRYCSKQCRLDHQLDRVKDEFVGKTLGRLYIKDIRRIKEPSGRLRFYADYMCDCGNIGITTVDSLRSGFTTSCGCYNIETSTGENNPSWNGGTTLIKAYLRKTIAQWKLDSMSNCNYQCVITGKKFDIIHHLYPFHSIIEEVFDITKIERKQEIGDYTTDELKELQDVTLKLHYKYPLGVCLTKEVHALFHSLYGSTNFTPDNFYEFQKRYNSGEFDYED